VKCYGIAVPNIFNLPYHNPLYLVKTYYNKKTILVQRSGSMPEVVHGISRRNLIIQGFPRAGKTFVLALIGLVFHLIGFHTIVYRTPTHQAADANCEALLQLMSSLNIECRVLRSYRPMTEVRKFLSKAKKSERQPESRNGETGEHEANCEGPEQAATLRPSFSCSRWHRILIRRDAIWPATTVFRVPSASRNPISRETGP
jgi:hypothetical protein